MSAEPKYNWFCVTHTWDVLLPRLEDLDAEGFEVFAICPMGGSDYVQVVYRKWRRRK